MADSPSSSTPSTPSTPAPSTSTLGTSAAGQAQAAQVQAKQAAQTPKQAPVQSSAPKQAQAAQAVINDPNAPKAAKVQAQKMLKQLSIKVDGKEYIENLPFEIPDDPKAKEWMARELQMSRMGQGRAQENAAIKKEINQLFQDIKADPFRVLQDPAIGIDVKDAVKKYIEREIENSKKSPEQLQLEAAQEELRQMKLNQDNEKKQRE